MTPRRRHSRQAAGNVGPRNLARQFFQQPHPQRRMILKRMPQCVDGQHAAPIPASPPSKYMCDVRRPVPRPAPPGPRAAPIQGSHASAIRSALRTKSPETTTYSPLQLPFCRKTASPASTSMHREALVSSCPASCGTLQQLGERMRRCRGQSFNAFLNLVAGHFPCRMPTPQAPYRGLLRRSGSR